MKIDKFDRLMKYINKSSEKIPTKFYKKFKKDKVIWLLDKEDIGQYDFNISKIGLTDQGEIIWCFESGCSCDDFPEKLDFTRKTLKSFKLKDKEDLRKLITSEEITLIFINMKNLIKRVLK